jgi:ParB family transcriptional regulator, chromosome partitioning protein
VAKRAGLPETVRMRHDEHYVEQLTGPAVSTIGRMVSIDLVDPNPEQPRQAMGDLSELMASIAEKGIIEPLIVRERSGRYQIIAGERRYQAAVQVGLMELPVVIRDVDGAEVIELALIENIQRKDLTPFEESEAMTSLAERSGYTHEDLARRLGKSRTSITETLSLHKMPEDVKNLCRLADISSKSLLLEIVRESDPEQMVALIERITRDGHATRQKARDDASSQKKPVRGRPKSFVFNYRPPTKAFNLKLAFARGKVERSEIIAALEGILEDLRQQQG